MAKPVDPWALAPELQDNLDTLKRWALGGAQTVAGFAAPTAGSLGAMGVAGIRSMLPGSGTYEQELTRYNQAAAPQDSVTDRVQAPGEGDFDFLRRWAGSPQSQRETMQAATMAAPIAVHASPNKWAGQPQDSARGTGEGGAAYGEGHYATVPNNARGIDQRYRTNNLDATGQFEVAGPHTDAYQAAASFEADGLSRAERLEAFKKQGAVRHSYDETLGDVVEFKDGSSVVLDDGSNYIELRGKRSDGGSFHVWDVPDTLLDYDARLSAQPDIVQRLEGAGVVKRGEDGRVILPNGEWGLDQGLRGSDINRAAVEGARWNLEKAHESLSGAGIGGHTYAGEAGSARTSGIEGDVPNFVIYRGEDIKPLGTFGSAEEWLASDLKRRLQPRIDAEEALRKAGQATPEAYAELRRRFSPEEPADPVTHQTGHRPAGADNGAPLSDLTGEGRIYPDDVYGPDGRRIYGTSQPGEDAVFSLARRMRGKPDAEITVYRAVPRSVKSNDILPGDWVALTKDYAALHGDGPLKGDYRIVTKKVRAGDIFTSGDSIHEWGYSPSK